MRLITDRVVADRGMSKQGHVSLYTASGMSAACKFYQPPLMKQARSTGRVDRLVGTIDLLEPCHRQQEINSGSVPN